MNISDARHRHSALRTSSFVKFFHAPSPNYMGVFSPYMGVLDSSLVGFSYHNVSIFGWPRLPPFFIALKREPSRKVLGKSEIYAPKNVRNISVICAGKYRVKENISVICARMYCVTETHFCDLYWNVPRHGNSDHLMSLK